MLFSLRWMPQHQQIVGCRKGLQSTQAEVWITPEHRQSDVETQNRPRPFDEPVPFAQGYHPSPTSATAQV